MNKEKKEKIEALLYCVEHGINFEKFYYKEKIEHKAGTPVPETDIKRFKTLEELKENHKRDGYCYHDPIKGFWCTKMKDLIGFEEAWARVSERNPKLERYRIEALINYQGFVGTRREVAKKFYVSEQSVYTKKGVYKAGIKVTKA